MSERRKTDPEGTRKAILDAAHQEFVAHGLSGARVEAIAARTHTVKRMIYYYFGSKEGLYRAVLERTYAGIRATEAQLDLGALPPREAIRRMVEATFDYHDANPDFVRLISVENIHHGRFVAQSEVIQRINVTVLTTLAEVLARGAASGEFRAGLDAVDVHMMISALSFFRVSNRHTFGRLFDRDMTCGAMRVRHRALVVDAVLGAVAAPTEPSIDAPVNEPGIRRGASRGRGG